MALPLPVNKLTTYYGLMRAYHDIWRMLIQLPNNFEKASIYSKKSIELAERADHEKYLPGVCNDLGVDYINCFDARFGINI